MCIAIMRNYRRKPLLTTDYITPFSAALKKNNFYGVQFHTEKSANAGEQILSNFLKAI